MQEETDKMAIPNRGPELLGVNIAFVMIGILTLGLRCFVRLSMVKAFGRDDALMVFAARLFFLMYIITSNIGVHYGTGRHYQDLTTENIARARHCWYLCYLFYSISMIIIKISIGFMLLRVSFKKIHIWILYGAIFVTIVAGGTFFFVCLFQCSPVWHMWDKTSPGKCVDGNVIAALGYVYSAFSIMSDFTFAIIPGFVVWELQLKRRAKLALLPLIFMGCIASSAIIARIPFIKYFDSPDFLWATTDIAICTTIEQGLAMIAGNLATLRPLFFKLGLATAPSGQAGYGGSAQIPANPTSNSHDKSDKSCPDMYKLSALERTRYSDEELVPHHDDLPKPSSAYLGCFNQPPPKGSRKTDIDNESEKSLNVKSSRSSEEDGMHILVSKSFYITDEERASRSSHGSPFT